MNVYKIFKYQLTHPKTSEHDKSLQLHLNNYMLSQMAEDLRAYMSEHLSKEMHIINERMLHYDKVIN